jgi:hypothetical protein
VVQKDYRRTGSSVKPAALTQAKKNHAVIGWQASAWFSERTEFYMKTPYFKKLLDPRWQKKRLETLELAEWKCEVCYDAESTLHVHHKQYFKGRDPWEYDVDQLAVVCAACHKATHQLPDNLLEVISRLPLDGPFSRDEAAFLLSGFSGVDLNPAIDWHRKLVAIGQQVRKAMTS